MVKHSAAYRAEKKAEKYREWCDSPDGGYPGAPVSFTDFCKPKKKKRRKRRKLEW